MCQHVESGRFEVKPLSLPDCHLPYATLLYGDDFEALVIKLREHVQCTWPFDIVRFLVFTIENSNWLRSAPVDQEMMMAAVGIGITLVLLIFLSIYQQAQAKRKKEDKIEALMAE